MPSKRSLFKPFPESAISSSGNGLDVSGREWRANAEFVGKRSNCFWQVSSCETVSKEEASLGSVGASYVAMSELGIMRWSAV
jgi:hypothetical protein